MSTGSSRQTGNRSQSNPLAARLVKRVGCLAGRISTALALVTGLTLSACAIREMLLNVRGPFIVSGWAMITVIAVSVSLLVFVAYVAATVASRYARSLEYPVLCTTTLSDGEIVKAYMTAALRYGRAAMALLLGLVPQAAYQLLESEYSVVPYRGPLAMVGSDLLVFLARRTLITILLGVGLWSIYLLAAALGTWLGTWWRSMLPAALTTLIGSGGIVIVTAYCLSEAISQMDIAGSFLALTSGFGLFVPVPCVLAFGCMRLAQHWARRW